MTRPTICRLYPLLPVFDDDGRVTGLERMGIYDELERMDALQPACRVTSVPFDELQKFLRISAEIGRHPKALYYIAAYRLVKEHICTRLTIAKQEYSGNSFTLFEKALIQKRLLDHYELKNQLISLAQRYEARYGIPFTLD